MEHHCCPSWKAAMVHSSMGKDHGATPLLWLCSQKKWDLVVYLRSGAKTLFCDHLGFDRNSIGSLQGAQHLPSRLQVIRSQWPSLWIYENRFNNLVKGFWESMILRHNYFTIPMTDNNFIPPEVNPIFTDRSNIGRDAPLQFIFSQGAWKSPRIAEHTQHGQVPTRLLYQSTITYITLALPAHSLPRFIICFCITNLYGSESGSKETRRFRSSSLESLV
jgi:hypothetical protein